MKLALIEGCTWSVMFGFGEMYFAAFAVFLTAGNTAIAFLTTMPHFLGAAAQLFGVYLTERFKARKKIIVPLAVTQALLYLPIFIIPALYPQLAVPALLVVVAMNVFAGYSVNPCWLSMMGDVVPPEERGYYFGKRSGYVILAILIASLVAGGVLFFFQRGENEWFGFATIFTVACMARLVSSGLLARHVDPPYSPAKEDYFTFLQFIRRMPHSNYARFALYFALMIGSANVAAPFFVVYMLRDLEWSYALFTINTATFLATQFVMVRRWGLIGDHHGNRVVIVASGMILTICPLLWTFSSNYVWLLCVQVAAGTGWSGFTIAAQNFMYDSVTPAKRARITSYGSLLNGLFAVIGSTLIGAWLANHLPNSYGVGSVKITFISSLPGVFVISAVLRLITTVILVPKFKEVKEGTHPIHPATLILRLAGGRIIGDILNQAIRSTRRER